LQNAAPSDHWAAIPAPIAPVGDLRGPHCPQSPRPIDRPG
jgi:hypothetical protein